MLDFDAEPVCQRVSTRLVELGPALTFHRVFFVVTATLLNTSSRSVGGIQLHTIQIRPKIVNVFKKCWNFEANKRSIAKL